MTAAPLRIAVLRALQLGDLLCAVPALRALRLRWPTAHVTLIGLPWARELLQRFPAYLDDFLEFPGHPGLRERNSGTRAVAAFLAEAQRRGFDLAVQLHGSGEVTNPLVAQLGARRIAGFYREGQRCPDATTFLRWRDEEREVARGIRLLAALGAPPCGEKLEAPVTRADRAELASVRGAFELVRGRYAVVHAGAQLASRRWFPERFAIVADELAARGLAIVLTGTAGEAELARRVAARMRAAPLDLVGRTSIGALTALLDAARIVVANDTGVRHIAAARRTPCVAVACGSDVRRWAARDPTQRLVYVHVPCRPCGHDRCPIGHRCAHDVESRAVIAVVDELLAANPIPAEAAPCAA